MIAYPFLFGSFTNWPDVRAPARSIEIPSIEPTADGWVGLCTITAQQFQDFLVLIERPDLIDDADLANAMTRAKRMDEFLEIIAAWTTRHTTAEVIERVDAQARALGHRPQRVMHRVKSQRTGHPALQSALDIRISLYGNSLGASPLLQMGKNSVATRPAPGKPSH